MEPVARREPPREHLEVLVLARVVDPDVTVCLAERGEVGRLPLVGEHEEADRAVGPGDPDQNLLAPVVALECSGVAADAVEPFAGIDPLDSAELVAEVGRVLARQDQPERGVRDPEEGRRAEGEEGRIGEGEADAERAPPPRPHDAGAARGRAGGVTGCGGHSRRRERCG